MSLSPTAARFLKRVAAASEHRLVASGGQRARRYSPTGAEELIRAGLARYVEGPDATPYYEPKNPEARNGYVQRPVLRLTLTPAGVEAARATPARRSASRPTAASPKIATSGVPEIRRVVLWGRGDAGDRGHMSVQWATGSTSGLDPDTDRGREVLAAAKAQGARIEKRRRPGLSRAR